MVFFQFQIKKWVAFLFGMGMGGRMSRRNAQHCERLWRNHAARRRRQIKIAGRNFYLESELRRTASRFPPPPTLTAHWLDYQVSLATVETI
jgi:hypothetical protein